MQVIEWHSCHQLSYRLKTKTLLGKKVQQIEWCTRPHICDIEWHYGVNRSGHHQKDQVDQVPQPQLQSTSTTTWKYDCNMLWLTIESDGSGKI